MSKQFVISKLKRPTPQSPPWKGTLFDINLNLSIESPLFRGEQGVCK